MGLASWLETLLLSEEPFTLFRYSRPVTAGAYVLIGLLHVAVCRMTGIYRSYRGRPFGELASGVLKANLISWGILAAFFYWMAILTQVRAAVTLFFFVNSALQLFCGGFCTDCCGGCAGGDTIENTCCSGME